MNVVLVNKTDIKGGAAIAAFRLFQSLSKSEEININFLVQEKYSNNERVTTVSKNKIIKLSFFLRFITEKLYFLPFEKSKEIRFQFSVGNTGKDLSKHPLLKKADIIHINWFNQGFLSLSNIYKILKLKKPVIWTLQDMWAFTGGCHYTGNCTNYQEQCGNCLYLNNPGNNDLSHKIYKKKASIYHNAPLYIIGTSQWIASKAKESSLLNKFPIYSIPIPIDNEKFKPKDKISVRQKLGLPVEKKIILFGAANALDKRKGVEYLKKALKIVSKNTPELANNIHCVIFGKAKTPIQLDFESTQLSFLNSTETITDLYSSADLFIMPSLQDNLPNTIMESLACGTPVVAFKTGGIPEMIEHLKTGYLANLKDEEDLANGIIFVLENAGKLNMQENSRNNAIRLYSPETIASSYINLYQKILIDYKKKFM